MKIFESTNIIIIVVFLHTRTPNGADCKKLTLKRATYPPYVRRRKLETRAIPVRVDFETLLDENEIRIRRVLRRDT